MKTAVARDIVTLVGLKDTTMGETLCDKKSAVILKKMDFPEPVIKVAVEPKTKADQQKMSEALVKLVAEDPSFRFLRDEETGQTIIEGMGELKEGITELFRAGEVLRRAKEDKRRQRVAGECVHLRNDLFVEIVCGCLVEMDGADGAVSLNCCVEARELVGRQCQQRDDDDRHAPHDDRRHRDH